MDSFSELTARVARKAAIAPLFFLLAVLSVLAPEPARAELLGEGIHFPVDSGWNTRYGQVEDLIRDEQWDEAIEGLVFLFKEVQSQSDTHRVESWSTSVPSGGGYALGVDSACERLLGFLPAEARSRFHEAIGPTLAQLWSERSTKLNPDELLRIRHEFLRRYPWSPIAIDLAREEVDQSLERGDVSRAMRSSAFLARATAAPANLPERETFLRNQLLLLEMAELDGDLSLWENELDRLKQSLREHESDTLGASLNARVQKRLEKPFTPPATTTRSAGPVRSPLLISRDRSASTERPFALGSIHARMPFELSELRDHVSGRIPSGSPVVSPLFVQKSAAARGLNPNSAGHPTVSPRASSTPASRGQALDLQLPFFPTAQEDRLYLQTYQEIVAFQLPSLKVRWVRSILEGDYEALGSIRAPAVGHGEVIVTVGNTIVNLDDDDGEIRWRKALYYNRNTKALEIGDPARFEKALAAEPSEETDGEEEESAVPSYVPATLAPPHSRLDHHLIAARVRVEGEILVYLLRVESDGSARWISYLGSTQSSNYLGMGATLSPPLAVGEQVFLLTNLGYVAAVDAEDGQILWLQAYNRLDGRGKIMSIEEEDRWQPNPILHDGGEIVVAPQDSDTLMAIDTKRGELLWRIPRGSHTTLLGAFKGGCILGGPQITAVDLSNTSNRGAVLWTWTPPGSSLISLGRAFVRQNNVFVSDLNALYTLDATSGRQKSAALWDFRSGGGNLLLLPNGHLAVASAGGFLVYSHLEEERRRVATLPPRSEERLLESAKLELKSGDIDAGLRTLTDWRKRQFPEPHRQSPAGRLLFEISEALRYSVDIQGESGSRAGDLLRMLVRTERMSEARAVAAFRAAQVYLRKERHAQVVEVLQEALSRNLGEISCPVNHFLAIPGRVIAEGILQEMRKTSKGQAAFSEFEWAAQDALSRARREGTHTGFLEVVRGFPLTRAAALAHRELAEYYLNQQNLNESVNWFLNYLKNFPDAHDYVKIALRATDLLTELGRYAEARDLLLALRNERPDAVLDRIQSAGLGETVKSYVTRRLTEPGFQEVDLPVEGRWLRFPVQLRWRAPANLLTANRKFLEPTGERPEHLKDTFFTYSTELIECRDLDTGLPRWSVEFVMIPGFKMSSSFRRHGPKSVLLGDSLIFQDPMNLCAIDTKKGTIAWHVPFEKSRSQTKQKKPGGAKKAYGSVFAERVLGTGTGKAGIFVRTDRNILYSFDPADGKPLFETELEFRNVRYKGDPIVLDDQVALIRHAPLEVAYFDAKSGEAGETIQLKELYPDAERHIKKILVDDENRALLLTSHDLFTVDLKERLVVSRYRSGNGGLEDAWLFPAYPDQAIIYGSEDRRIRLAGISLVDESELWHFDKFKEKRFSLVKPAVYSDDSRLYVLYGSDTRYLSALDIREGPERGEFTALSIWQEDKDLGMLLGRRLDLLITQDSLIFADRAGSSVNIFDKFTGLSRPARADPELNQFLADKRNFECRAYSGVLTFLTDRGDGGFGSQVRRLDLYAEREKIDRLRRYLVEPHDWENVIWLALSFFGEGNSDAALEILNLSLLSERLPSLDSPGKYQLLEFLLDGIKEEYVKTRQPEITCRRFRAPPMIDGELNDNWNRTHSVSLNGLLSVNLMPSPGQEPDIWKGEEDLSGTLYTGWDDLYFYFALDVQDNRIYPYDRDAKVWKGDCLVIGLDPEGDGGMYQRPNDQLLTLALTVPKRDKKKGEEEGEGEEEDKKNKPDGQYSVKKKDDNSGVIYEVAIPWSNFEDAPGGTRTPQPNKQFGLSLVITDDDAGQGATKMMSINPCHLLPRDQSPRFVWKHMIPQYFPKVVLK